MTPWIKLWRTMPNDEKLQFLVRRYGHDCGWFWTTILCKVDGGVLLLDEEIFADLCLVSPERYAEIRALFISKALLQEDDEGRLLVTHWADYQVGVSTDRVRKHRERSGSVETSTKHECNANVTPMKRGCNADETLAKRDVTRYGEGEEEGEKEGEGRGEEGSGGKGSKSPSVSQSSTALVKVEKRGNGHLPPDQLVTYHAILDTFEESDKAKALIYQDEGSTKRECSAVKTLVKRAHKLAPELPKEFIFAAMKKLKSMANTTHKGKIAWTPSSLVTPWIWSLVIEGMKTGQDIDESLRETIAAVKWDKR